MSGRKLDTFDQEMLFNDMAMDFMGNLITRTSKFDDPDYEPDQGDDDDGYDYQGIPNQD